MPEPAFRPNWFSKPGDTLSALLSTREMTPEKRAAVLGNLVKVGMPISMEHEFDEFPFVRATSEEDRIPGETITVAKGGTLKTPADAAAGEADNPDVAAEAKAAAPDDERPPEDK